MIRSLMLTLLVTVLVVLGLGPAGALAQGSLAEWNLFRTPGDQITQPATFEEVGIAGSPITRSLELSPNAGVNSFNSTGWASNAVGDPSVAVTDAFVELGITVQPGFTADLDSLFLGSRSSGSGPDEIGVFTSGDGFTTPVFTISQFDTSFENSEVDLSSFTDVTGSFAIRFMNIGGTTTADPDRQGDMDLESTWRIGNFFESGTFSSLRITGTVVAVPEPGTLVLLALFGGLVTARHRSTRG